MAAAMASPTVSFGWSSLAIDSARRIIRLTGSKKDLTVLRSEADAVSHGVRHNFRVKLQKIMSRHGTVAYAQSELNEEGGLGAKWSAEMYGI